YHSEGADISIIEANRGLYDGLDEEGSCSSASLAKLTGTPVVLVLDCTKATRTMAAVVKGLVGFDTQVDIKAVVLNNVAGPRHEGLLRRTIERYTDVKVIGAVERKKRAPILMRHLGLTPAEEHRAAERTVKDTAKTIERSIDIEKFLEIAKGAETITVPEGDLYEGVRALRAKAQGLRVVVLKDEAFQFYYPENIEALRVAGMEVIEVEATRQKGLPPCEVVYIGGGFPETNALALSKNELFRRDFLRAVQRGTGVYAECGGLMFLGEMIKFRGRQYPMTGVLPISFQMKQRPVAHGYAMAKAETRSAFYREGTVLRGHEFHYSKPVITGKGDFALTLKMQKGRGITDGWDGIVRGRVFGGYIHLHALGSPEWIETLVRVAEGRTG
ncbi:MAG: hydrogenobyrinic acid a,c-diamide synthase (glutamine-hydrolyzing), partial [Nitrospirae bacterium]